MEVAIAASACFDAHMSADRYSILNPVRSSLWRSLERAFHDRPYRPTPQNQELAAILTEQQLTVREAIDKFDRATIRIATFGLVSRGKSSVLNALLGQNVLPTGPTHGVTQWPYCIEWPDAPIATELIDTPGLDEVGGTTRSRQARHLANQADLILFVVSGDITQTEYNALRSLWQTHKPLILVFNKIDLYPDRDRETIYEQLQQLGGDIPLQPEEIVTVAAAPMPLRVRVEYPDGRTVEEWETPPPEIENLRQKLYQILQRDGQELLDLNALVSTRHADKIVAKTAVKLCDRASEERIWQFVKYKAIAVSLNPIAILDVAGGAIADLILIRSLAKLYGLPMTSFEAGKLLRTIVKSSGGLLLAELGSSALLGVGKTAAGWATDLPGFAGTAVVQGAMAGYGTYAVGRAAKAYLERGCTWGETGADTLIGEILDNIDRDTILNRLRQFLSSHSRV